MKHRLFNILVIGVVLGSLLFTSVAYASDGKSPSPGITPDSPWYVFDKIGKSLGMAFTFGAEAKAKKSLKYADERLAEAQKMASENKTAALEKAIADFEKYIGMLQEKLADIKEQAASDNLSESAALALIRQLETLNQMRDRVRDRDRDCLDHAANMTMDGQENALRHLGRDKPDRAFDICDNITNRQLEKIRFHGSDNVTSGNVTSGNITRDLDYMERISHLEDEMEETAAAHGANVTALQERLAHSTANRLDVLSGVYDKVPEKAQLAIVNAIENSVEKYQRVADKLDDKYTASVNATINKMPPKLQEAILPSLSNHAPFTATNSGNSTVKVEPRSDNSIKNTDKSENKPDQKSTTGNANHR